MVAIEVDVTTGLCLLAMFIYVVALARLYQSSSWMVVLLVQLLIVVVGSRAAEVDEIVGLDDCAADTRSGSPRLLVVALDAQLALSVEC